MSFQNFGPTERFVAYFTDSLVQAGITLTTGYDLRHFAEHVRSGRVNHSLAKAFDPDDASFGTLHDTFWVVGHDQTGRLAHAQALRRFDLGDTTLASYLARHFAQFAPAGMQVDPQTSFYRPGPGSSSISGHAVYHGEFWIDAGLNRFGGAVLSSILCRYAFLMARQRWSPDAIFCFMANAVAHKGLAARTGWTHLEPGAIHLVPEDQSKTIVGNLGYVLSRDIDYILDSVTPVQQPVKPSGEHRAAA